MKETSSFSKATWISILLFCLLVWLALYFAANLYTVSVPGGTLYLARHAEKLDASADPALSAEGIKRAEALAHVLSEADIAAIYVSQFLRTQQTAAPLANLLGLDVNEYSASDADALAEHIRKNHPGKSVLVVGHSNTVDDIAAAFGSEGISELGDKQYDRLFVLHLRTPATVLQKLRYGAPTP